MEGEVTNERKDRTCKAACSNGFRERANDRGGHQHRPEELHDPAGNGRRKARFAKKNLAISGSKTH